MDEAANLDRLASTLSVRPMMSFADNREVPTDVEGDDDSFEAFLDSWEEWFDPSDALPTFEALIAALQRPDTAGGFDTPDEIVDELRDVERCLRIARETGAQFRLEVH